MRDIWDDAIPTKAVDNNPFGGGNEPKIKIKKAPNKGLTTVDGQSLFIAFKYDPKLVEAIKNLPFYRRYHAEEKEWELPVAAERAVREIEAKLFGVTQPIQVVSPDKGQQTPPDKAGKRVISRVAGMKYKTKPYGHQEDGVAFGIQNHKHLNADEQGLGKTKQVIDIAVNLKGKEVKKVLVICGVNSLKFNWVKEIKTHSDEQGFILGQRYNTRTNKTQIGSTDDKLYDLDRIISGELDQMFIITNIESLRQARFIEQPQKSGLVKSVKVYPITEKLKAMCASGVIDMIVIDECHKCKNPQAEQTKNFLELKAPRQIALTGTPIMNSPLDCYVPLRWLDIERHSFYSFQSIFCLKGGYGGYQVMGYKNLDILHEMLNGVMLRRRKHEVLDLPPKVYTEVVVEMDKDQEKVYDGVQEMLRAEIDKIALSPNPLGQLIRLRQATGNPALLSTKFDGKCAKMERLKDLVDEAVANGEKVLVYSNWTDMTKFIRAELAQYNPAYITGEINDQQVELEKDKFFNNDTCKVMIGTIGRMGTGHTLTAATTVIFYDSPWTQADKHQAEDRTHRIGTTGTISVITLVTKDTIDEMVEALIEMKGEYTDMLINNNKNLVRKFIVKALEG